MSGHGSLVLACHIDGTPATKGSYRPVRNRHTGKTLLVGMSRHEHEWRNRVARAVRSQWFMQHPTRPMPHLDTPLSVRAVFLLPRPKSVTPAARPWPTVAPDVDKLARCLLDALTDSGLITDDSRIIHLDAHKHYADPPHKAAGADITIHTLDKEES